jgi:hypothetical protein
MGINKFISKEKRKKLINSNQWLQKLLFRELPFRIPTPQSELFVLRREERDNGDVVWLPTRATIEEVLNVTEGECFDEGNAFSTYASEDEYDEGLSPEEFIDEIFEEGNAFTLIYSCPDEDNPNTIRDFITTFIPTPSNTTYYMVLNIPYDGLIRAVSTKLEGGTLDCQIEIGGTLVAGTAQNVTSAKQQTTATSDNFFNIGEDISAVISSVSSPSRLTITLEVERNV